MQAFHLLGPSHLYVQGDPGVQAGTCMQDHDLGIGETFTRKTASAHTTIIHETESELLGLHMPMKFSLTDCQLVNLTCHYYMLLENTHPAVLGMHFHLLNL